MLAQADWVKSHQKETVQSVVDALVATMHWINTHSAADIADAHAGRTSSRTARSRKAQYVAGLTTDKGQFLPDGIMPAGGPKTVYAMEKLLGVDVGKVTLANTFTNTYAMKANKLEDFTVTTTPAGADRLIHSAPELGPGHPTRGRARAAQARRADRRALARMRAYACAEDLPLAEVARAVVARSLRLER